MNDETGVSAGSASTAPMGDSTALAERLNSPDAVLTSTDLRQLGYPRRAIDQIWRGCKTVNLPGFSRPMVRVADFRRFIAEHSDDGAQVR
jgi:hypothetical protein